ncbi:MAG TPA: helix-turn-helix domain-containing protein [Candidatus Acidoferrales bacterium]|nr:helix-turn-helix domain-containing protein [Candidatus Acidoferrales bacterium]
MSVRLMGSVFELDIPASEKLVLLAMADHARDDGTGCYPSVRLLARKTSQSRRGVQGIIGRLEARGLLKGPTPETRKGGRAFDGRGITTEYRIVLDKGERGSLFSPPDGRTAEQRRVNASAGRANLTAKKGEPGSPEPLRTIDQPSVNQNPTPAPEAENLFASIGIPLDLWSQFVEMRHAIRRPLTASGIDLMARKLALLASEGNDAREVLEQSIRNCYPDVYPTSRKGGENGSNGHDRRAGGGIAPPDGKRYPKPEPVAL